jgi:hydrogenase maturation protease
MNSAIVQRIADAILYEGYILYPYRPSSMKNRQRWNFGGLCPRSYSESERGNERWSSQTECLVMGTGATTIGIQLRFLHLIARQAAEFVPNGDESDYDYRNFRAVETIKIEGRLFQTWQEALERQFHTPLSTLDCLAHKPERISLHFPATESMELLRDAGGRVVGAFMRTQRELHGAIEVSTERLDDALFRIHVQVLNLTGMADTGPVKRDQAMMSSLVSSHLILTVEGGEFVSLLDPPAQYRDAAAQCQNVGGYPVLVGEAGATDTMFFSPIILYDYPKIAPESPQSLFDGTEIDEILALRILTLTDEEKKEMRETDERTRAILECIEAHPEQLANLHGAIRSIGPAGENE